MPSTLDDMTYEEMREHERRGNTCAECNSLLTVCSGAWWGYESQYILACSLNKKHEGLARDHVIPFHETPAGQLVGKTPEWRKKEMEKEHGVAKAHALAPYQHDLALTEEKAKMVVATLWPSAPEAERLKAAMICNQYGLNPLMKHLYLLPYNKKDKQGKIVGTDWSIVMGIKATRLIGARQASYAYVDDTPRAATDPEILKQFGDEIPQGKVISVCKLRDTKGNTAIGFGLYSKDENPKGVEKGNTRRNMANIRAERQAVERLRPGAMPSGVEVVDDAYIDAEYTDVTGEVDTTTGEITAPATVDDIPFTKPETTEPETTAPAFLTENTLAAIRNAMAQAGWKKKDSDELDYSRLGALCRTKGWKVANLNELTEEMGQEALAEIADISAKETPGE